ncbi:A disintegrin and metalloproteinase with thrombospondin motifs like, partial [Operophtera brumata]
IHEHMTPDELRSVFHVDHHTLVPQYHLINITHHLSRRHIPTSHSNNKIYNEKTPHEKHEKKWRQNQPSLLNDEMFLKAKQLEDVDIIGELNNTVSVNFSANSSEVEGDLSDMENFQDDLEKDVHKVEMVAFGRHLKLTLKKQEGLLKKDGVKLWRVEGNDTLPHGVDYEDDEELGDLYQDEENGAALLIRKHPKHGKLLV